jgi:DNA transposition AAA+ family ATPase
MKTPRETIAPPGQGGKLGDFCDTPTAIDIRNVFHICHVEGELGIVTGEPGVGKTSAAQRYVAASRCAYLITMSPATSALVPSLTRVGEGIKAFPSTGSACAWSDAIRGRLSYEEDQPVLLIDEAHHLADAAVEELRAIFDATSIGIVFIGSRELREHWSGKRWAQLTSRVFQRIDLEGPVAADIEAICKQAGVEGKRPRELLRRAAAMPGGLRVVQKILSVAAKLAGPDQPLKSEHIEAAFRDREAVT